MDVLFSSNGYRPNKGIKREHDPDQARDVNSQSPKVNGTPFNHVHQHKKKKGHHHRHQTGRKSESGHKKKKSKHNSQQSEQQEDTLMSGGLGDMSEELGEPVSSTPRSSQHSTEAQMDGDGGGSKKKKNKVKHNKTVRFEELSSNYRPPQVDDEEEESEGLEMNGDSAQRETSKSPARSHDPILPPTSSPILPPTRPRSSLSYRTAPPVLPQASPSQMNPLYVPPTNSTPILPPASPFRKRRASAGNSFSTVSPCPRAAQLASAKPIPTKAADPKPKDDEWEFKTGKIRATIGNPMEKDAQREESKSRLLIYQFENLSFC